MLYVGHLQLSPQHGTSLPLTRRRRGVGDRAEAQREPTPKNCADEVMSYGGTSRAPTGQRDASRTGFMLQPTFGTPADGEAADVKPRCDPTAHEASGKTQITR